MIKINNFTVKKLSKGENKVMFEFAPLPNGYGHTLGNILRRILLSSIPGAAVVGIKIEGLQHEYSTLKGVSDDVLTIILSLKNIVVRSVIGEPAVLKLNVKGKKGQVTEVKASDIDLNSDIEIVNKDYVVTKLTDDVEFNAEITVESGIGYKQNSKDARREIDLIPVDSSFSPVVLVNYEVTPTRVGQETELDQLNLYVETNGSVDPEEALAVASQILNEMTSHLLVASTNLIDGDLRIPSPVATAESEKSEKNETRNLNPLPVKDLNLSTRLTNALLRSGYTDLVMLDGMSEEEIVNIRGLGTKSVDELLQILKDSQINVL